MERPASIVYWFSVSALTCIHRGQLIRINHRITIRSDDPRIADLERAGARIEKDSDIIWVFNVTEDDPAWPELKRIAPDRFEPWCVSTIWTEAEMDAAEYFKLIASGHHGYPQPEADFGYRQSTYDTAEYCRSCGIGGIQNAPFRFRKEPRIKRSQFLQLNWIFDELFIRSEMARYLDAAGITGIDFVSPVLHNTGEPVDGWYQIKIGYILPAALYPEGLQQVTCKENNEEDGQGVGSLSGGVATTPHCGRIKYHMYLRGALKFDQKVFQGAPDVVKTCEWFGSGASAFQLILVSQKFRRICLKNQWRGVSFEPVSLVQGVD